MIIKFNIINITKDFIFLENKDKEELKIKKENMPEDIKTGDEISFFQKNDSNEKSLSKDILNEILNNSEK
jgi:predicted RNA-binding protein (virulence factor B family)